jgi:TonB family protein
MSKDLDKGAFTLFQSLDFADARTSSFSTSLLFHAGLLLVLLTVPMMFTEKLKVRFDSVPLAPPREVVKVKPLKQPPLKVVPPPVEKIVAEVPKLVTPPPEPRVAPVAIVKPPEPVKIPEVKLPETPKVVTKTVRLDEPESPEVAAPKMEVRTNVFTTGSSAKPTVNAAAHEVQTGGFGDPNGVHPDGRSDKVPNIASLGSFDLPAGPGVGNGTGGARGVRGVVASAGFGNGVAQNGSGGGTSRSVHQGGFADAQSTPAAATPKKHDAGPPQTPVDILSKPKPEYTDEARAMKIEGEVLVRVLFTASGEARVIEMIRGLGHGLDENAVRAAQRIRFKPALRDGEPVDSSAIVHIVFQLAY